MSSGADASIGEENVYGSVPAGAFGIDTLVRPNVLALCPYSTARDEYQGSVGVFLDANESPYPTGFNRYPDPHQKALKARISEIKGVPVGNIFLGNGSDEAIDLIFRVFCNPGKDNVVAIEPSYGMYGVAAATNDIEIRPFRLGDDFSLDPEAILSACDSATKGIFICSPNNPSGNAFPIENILDIVRRFSGIVVVDEAYIDFSSGPSLIKYIGEMPNLVVLQTMSKARGMAGLRLGMAFASSRIISLMSMIKYPYNISSLVQEAALKALEKPVDEEVAQIVKERGRLVSALGKFACVRRIYPSDANFLLVEFDDADRMYGHLLRDGIIVRNRNNVPGCKGCLRITVGLPEENDRLLKSIKNY
ncbi:MAG: histidinol-phosphate transaminase [Candidatus Cryptobacteroides sp.]